MTLTAPPSRPAAGAASGRERGLRRRRTTVLAVEVVVVAAIAGFAGEEAPGFASAVGAGFARLRHPDPGGLAAAAACELVSFLALAQVPRWLLRRSGVALAEGDAVALTLAANGMAIVLPAGTVSSSVWSAHQYARRGARAAQASWVVLAAGFASSVTLIGIGIAGAGAAGVVPGAVAAAACVAFVAGTFGFVALTHRLDHRHAGHGLVMPSPAVGIRSRLRAAMVRLDSLLAEAAGQRAGWATGAAVLFACLVNWLADAGCLTAVFSVLRLPVPWAAVLLAYTAGQLAGAVVPLPGGFGVVEGGTIGVLIALGMPAAPAVAVVAVYRLVGYWAPLLLAVPAYGWARRRVELL